MTPLIIALNGPPGCGKDTLANWLSARSTNELSFVHTKFAAPLKDALHTLLRLRPYEYDETKKNEILYPYNKTLRQLYIDLAENFLKPACGKDIFGHLWLRAWMDHVRHIKNTVWIISDLGFKDELIPIAEAFPGQVLIIQIERPGHTFKNDSRQYVYTEYSDVPTWALPNVGNLSTFFARAETVLGRLDIILPPKDIKDIAAAE